jgi:16S rRNA (adenine1518-N6/adenine1519-N6)-dimethyltransferase
MEKHVKAKKYTRQDKKEVKTRKALAQHWLKSEQVLQSIVKASECKVEDVVLEIGPGTGVLTGKLIPLVGSLVAVEIDSDLCKRLVKEYGKIENFLLLQGDFLSVDLRILLGGLSRFEKPNKVVANIPYNITGLILEKLLGSVSQPNPEPYDSIVLLVQKEVADRLTASSGNKVFGALSVKVQYLAKCEYICTVPATAFYPAPKVDSAVVKLTPRKLEVLVKDAKKFETLVKLGFGAKRKMLRNNLHSIIERSSLSELMSNLGISENARAEEISVTQWVDLANMIGDLKLETELSEDLKFEV